MLGTAQTVVEERVPTLQEQRDCRLLFQTAEAERRVKYIKAPANRLGHSEHVHTPRLKSHDKRIGANGCRILDAFCTFVGNCGAEFEIHSLPVS